MNTLVVTYPGCILFEVMPATERLHPRFPVRVTTPDGGPLLNSNGMRIEADLPYRAVDPGDYACILVPGGDPGPIMDHPEIDRILRGDTVVGGICAGVLVLARAGLLAGRTMTHPYTEERGATPEMLRTTKPYWKGATLLNRPVVVDGKIVTALPEAYDEFAHAVAALL